MANSEYGPLVRQVEASSVTAKQPAFDRRVVGAIVDLALLSGLFVWMAMNWGVVENGSMSLDGWPVFAYVSSCLGYFIVMEGVLGATIGKALCNLRVEVPAGKNVWSAIVVRNLLRIVDGLPLFYFVGFVTMLATGERRQRIGDIATGTRVVRR